MPQNIGYLTADKTTAGDERFIPYYAVEPLLEFLPPADTGITIWCPFDEFWSAYVQTFRANGYNVVYGSLATGQDFFTSQPAHWDIMISNPPFSKKDAVLKRACQLGKPFALLLPANSIQGKSRFEIFQNNIQLLCFDSRIGFHDETHMNAPQEGASFGSAYFCRDFLPSKLELRMLNKTIHPLVRS